MSDRSDSSRSVSVKRNPIGKGSKLEAKIHDTVKDYPQKTGDSLEKSEGSNDAYDVNEEE
jgi:hypothetical protein